MLIFQNVSQISVANYPPPYQLAILCSPQRPPSHAARRVAQRQIGSPQLGVGDNALHITAFRLAAAHGHLEAWWIHGCKKTIVYSMGITKGRKWGQSDLSSQVFPFCFFLPKTNDMPIDHQLPSGKRT